MVSSFQFSALPKIIFGPGKRRELPSAIKNFGSTALLITGTTSIHTSGHGDEMQKLLSDENITLHSESIGSEPSPVMIDEIAGKYKGRGIDVVVAVGGGSNL
jgi:alcohol dehydrogenase class IV